VTELSWRAFISALLESINEMLVIRRDDKWTAFNYMSEVPDSVTQCQELAVVRSHLLSEAELIGVESQGLPRVVNMLLQGSANTNIRTFGK
jgi:hypothetical protein